MNRAESSKERISPAVKYRNGSARRRLNWVSALDPAVAHSLDQLQTTMAEFYSSSPTYYSDIDVSRDAWRTDPVCLDIIRRLSEVSGLVAEIGCGRANICEHLPDPKCQYVGCDFSEELLDENRRRFPAAEFTAI